MYAKVIRIVAAFYINQTKRNASLEDLLVFLLIQENCHNIGNHQQSARYFIAILIVKHNAQMIKSK